MQHNSWPFSISEEIAPFHRKKEELTLSAVGEVSYRTIKASAPVIGRVALWAYRHLSNEIAGMQFHLVVWVG